MELNKKSSFVRSKETDQTTMGQGSGSQSWDYTKHLYQVDTHEKPELPISVPQAEKLIKKARNSRNQWWRRLSRDSKFGNHTPDRVEKHLNALKNDCTWFGDNWHLLTREEKKTIEKRIEDMNKTTTERNSLPRVFEYSLTGYEAAVSHSILQVDTMSSKSRHDFQEELGTIANEFGKDQQELSSKLMDYWISVDEQMKRMNQSREKYDQAKKLGWQTRCASGKLKKGV